MSGTQQKKQVPKAPPTIGLWHMLRDVLIASINKGQFPLAVVALIFIVAIIKMPEQDVSKLMFRFLELAENGRIAGYVISVLLLAGWFFHSRFQRRKISQEMERLTAERTQLQITALGDRVKSSEGNR